jgi:hypothetical protein
MPLHDKASVKYFAENLVASHCDVPCLVIGWKPFGLPTNRPTDGQTNAKQYTPNYLNGGITGERQLS